MSKIDVTTKLAATEASLKRWQTRLKRAITKVNELDRLRRRYQALLLNPNPVAVKMPKEKITAFEIMTGLSPAAAETVEAVEAAVVGRKTSPPPGSLAEKYKAQEQALVQAAKEVELDIPDFLKRDPKEADAQALKEIAADKERRAKAKREAKNIVATKNPGPDAKRMPLTGKEALAFIKKKK